ncbi:hypothetical protein [Hymenobacter fodinae]|uniref:Lipoprotein n=1 Tax=Hymenobacter fodinae TaxID=2510796 RepID=A0A4Z0P950_9BACT|nr:hypothetical protein [Hymenobacter fodinae]TGE08448.1 hypothetical protein EU556_12105 [Hymenobacter fodinae]
MKRTLTLVALLAAAEAATAQTGCSTPVVKVFRDQQEVPNTGAALVPQVTLQVSSAPACAEKVSYQFSDAEVTLIRGRRPLLPTKRVSQTAVDLSDMMPLAKPGDRVYVFVPYKNLTVVAPDGKRTPYPVPELAPKQENGIYFSWTLMQ